MHDPYVINHWQAVIYLIRVGQLFWDCVYMIAPPKGEEAEMSVDDDLMIIKKTQNNVMSSKSEPVHIKIASFTSGEMSWLMAKDYLAKQDVKSSSFALASFFLFRSYVVSVRGLDPLDSRHWSSIFDLALSSSCNCFCLSLKSFICPFLTPYPYLQTKQYLCWRQEK